MTSKTDSIRVPTLAAVKKAAVAVGFTAIDRIDVGIRLDANDERTENSMLWPEDSDLDDIYNVTEVFKRWRKSGVPEGVCLDLYVYHEWDGLMGNADLFIRDGEWFVAQKDYRAGQWISIEEVVR